jgi:hypothetical protein
MSDHFPSDDVLAYADIEACIGIWHNALTSVVSNGRCAHRVYNTICRTTGGSSLHSQSDSIAEDYQRLTLGYTDIQPRTCTVPQSSSDFGNREIDQERLSAYVLRHP